MIVAHDAARLLPGLVGAVREQTHPVQRMVGVDTASRDRSGTVLTDLLGPDAVFGMERDTGYGAAVARALQRPAARRPARPDRGTIEWIWLLHDDCEPAADALEQLLAAAGRSRSVAVLGPKLRDLSDRRVVREAGITTDRAGRRLTGVEPGEIDQGQHDGDRAVLAVSSAGMLVRRDVWEQLGGFDPNLPLFRDDIDFCWRAHAAGYDVRVVTDAVVYHREMSARQIRKTPATGGHPRMLDRRSALYVFAVNMPLRPMLTAVTGCAVGSLARAVWFLLTKQQRKAAAHVGAVAWLLRHPLLLWRERRRRATHRKHGYAVLRRQLPRGRTLGRVAEAALGSLSRGSGYNSGGLHHAMVDDPEDELPMPATDSVIRRVLTSPGVLLFIGLAVVALVAERSLSGSVLSGSSILAGGALVPSWGGAGSLWREYLAGYHDAGIGSAASTPAYIGVLAVLATLLGGKPWLATDVLLLGGVPLAGMTAYLATRRLTSVLAARVWIAASYALLPVATGAIAAGRIGTMVAFVLLPLIGMAVGRVLNEPPRTARRAAWAAGLLTAIAAAFVPLAWPAAVIAAIAAAAAWSWLGARTVINAWIIAAVPAVLLIPWTIHLVTSPAAFLGEAGLVRTGLAAASLRPQSLLLLSPGGPGLPPFWVTAGLALPALAALFIRRRPALVYAGWGIALAGLVMALLVSRARITPPQGGPAVSAWPGLAMAIAAAGLLLAATPLIEAIGRTLFGAAGSGSAAGARRLAAVAGLAAVVSAPALAAGYWLASGVDGPVTAAAPPILPPFVASAAAGPDRTRTLVLRSGSAAHDGEVLSYAVLRATDPGLGEAELTEPASSVRALDRVVATLVAEGGGSTADSGQALGQFGIGYVLLPAPIDQALASQLNAVAGLQPLTRASAYDLWQVTGPAARVRVVTPGGSIVPVPSGRVGVHAVIAPGTSGTLELAEASGGWSATLDGKSLTRLAAPVDGWAQGFELPAGGGRLVITRNQTARNLTLGGEALALLAVVVLALPGSRPVPAPAEAAPDAEAPPAAPRRRARAAGARGQSAAGARGQSAAGAPGQSASGTRAGRRERRLEPALAGMPAGGGARPEGDRARPGEEAAAGAGGHSFGNHDGTEHGAAAGYDADAGHDADPGYGPDPEYGDLEYGADPEYGTDPEYGADPEYDPGAGYGADPVAPPLDDDPAPWVGLPPATPRIAATPGADAAPGAPEATEVASAASRRARGAHAARHGKSSRRWRGSSPDRGDS